MSAGFRLATSPTTWGVDFADAPDNPAWRTVLDDIAESPLSALELGPVGYLPEDAETLRGALAARGLEAVGSFVFQSFHDPTKAEDVLDVTARTCRMVSAAAGKVLVLIDRPDEVRAATAGRSEAAPRLAGPARAEMYRVLQRAMEIADSNGLVPVLHPHVGGYIEFEDEIEDAVAELGIQLCLDSGHLAYAGADPVDMIRRHSHRLAHFHFKDVRREVLARVSEERLGFWAAIEAGVFCPMGDGVVRPDQVVSALAEVGYEGYATIEQDRVPGSGAALVDLVRSVEVLVDAGCRV